ncbi:MAG TPA: glycosyl transferase family 2, partial [Erysipelotrichaceae bacterium]|nr:glycosyl transferase family 2 [Erysipelotrichaceae bacterium]
EQEYRMLCKFWPAPVARIIAGGYKSAQTSNKLK